MQPQPAKEKITAGAAPTCQSLSHFDEPCNALATMQCEKCERWFCAAHAEDLEWHACALEDGDEGGEG